MSDLHDRVISKLLCFRRRFSLTSNESLKQKVAKLNALCISVSEQDKNTRQFRQGTQRCLSRLTSIIRSSSSSQMQILEPHDIISCTIKIFLLFDDVLHHNYSKYEWKCICNNEMTMICYRFLLESFAQTKPKKLIEAVVDNVAKEKFWKIEDLCHVVVSSMLKFDVSGVLIAESLCDKMQSEDQDAGEIAKILLRLLEAYKWPRNQHTDSFIEKLLELYQSNLGDASKKASMAVRKKLEMCVRRVVDNVSNDTLLTVLRCMCLWIVNGTNMEDSVVLNYGSLLEYAAKMHQTNSYSKTLTSDLFPLLLKMMSSSKKLVNLLGNRVLQYLIDRNGNKKFFGTPKLFFEDEPTDLKTMECLYEDKIFFKTHREVIHDSVIKSIVNHCTTCLNLEMTYCTVCLFAIEIPCGFTAAALVCLTMNIQDLMLEEENLPRETGYHIHAVVVSIMSLLCWIHEAKVFSEYVNKIILERMQWAPHLNPPLQMRYEHAEHDVLWNKPELFFVDWEVRYGLWKRFRLRNDTRKISNSHDAQY